MCCRLGHGGLTTAYFLTKAGRFETQGGNAVICGTIVMTIHTPVTDRLVVHTKQAAYRSYVIGMVVPVGTVPKALYSDTCDPCHFVRLADKGCRQKSRAGYSDRGR